MEMDELDDLFSKAAPKAREKKATEEKKSPSKGKGKPKTMLDSKRNQNLGILVKSKGLEIGQIEDAVYNCESSIPMDVLEAIKEAQGTKEELEAIGAFMEAKDEAPLDNPDQFLWDLSKISCFNDRLTCLTFQNKFQDSLSDIETRLNNIKSICEFLIVNESLKQIMSVTLACGNYLNGGNKQRGQADGFNIDILPKLKDLKSKDNSTNLLAYIIKICILRYDEKKGTLESVLPVPEPGDVEKCIHVDFEAQRVEADKIKKELDVVKRKTGQIADKSPEDLKEPFGTQMNRFLEKADVEMKELIDLIEECINKFRNLFN